MTKNQESALRSVLIFAKSNTYSSLYQALPEIPENDFEDFFKSIPILTVEKIRSHAGSLVHLEDRDIRYLLSEFDFQNIGKAILLAQRVDETWHTVAQEIKANDIRSALHILPKHWQTGPMFYRTCRALGITAMPLTSANEETKMYFIRETNIDMIVSTAEEVQWTAARLHEIGLEKQIRSWIVVVPLGVVPKLPQVSGSVHVEHHLFPGIPLGVSTDGLNIPVSDEYFVEVEEKGIYVTSLARHAVPFIRLFVPGRAKVKNVKTDRMLSFTLRG